MKFYIIDERNIWHQPAIEAAKRAGYDGHRITRGAQATEPGIGFIRPHADPAALKRNHLDYLAMREKLTMIQDPVQVALYEDKYSQTEFWSDWMPKTWLVASREEARIVSQLVSFPIVSKAKEGASSVNVRIIKNAAELQRHIDLVFGRGIPVNCCSGGAQVTQRGYLILQTFVPHTVTWRVNSIGNARAVFKRYCYKDRNVAETGNVEPVMVMDDEIASLLEFANRVFEHLGTRWCAIDVLRDGSDWRFIESSLAWPWPSPGKCSEAPFFGTGKNWSMMWDVMFDEYKAGAWLKI